MKRVASVFGRGAAALAALLALAGAAGTAEASTTIAAHKCTYYACDSSASLKNEARRVFSHLPVGSIVFVSSQQYPLSAFARICTGPRGEKNVCLITSGDLGAIELDNQVFARAAKVAPIDIPAHIATTATQVSQEAAQGEVLRVLTFGMRHGMNPWHNIFNPLTWYWMEFTDGRTFETHRIYAKDRITLRFIDGSTAEVELIGPGAPSGQFFRFIWESIRLPNGEPLALSPPLPATPSPSVVNVTPPWAYAAFLGTMPFNLCQMLVSHCEYIPGTSIPEYDCYYRRETMPCG